MSNLALPTLAVNGRRWRGIHARKPLDFTQKWRCWVHRAFSALAYPSKEVLWGSLLREEVQNSVLSLYLRSSYVQSMSWL
jgi:hypothetical protein